MIYTPLPEEYVASAIRRGNEILGIRKNNSTEYLIQKTAKKRKLPISDGEFKFPILFTENRIEEETLQNHTLYPLAAALGTTHLATTKYTPTHGWKVCLPCIAHDLEHHGTPFIRRQHILSSVQICNVHATKLYSSCPSCLKSILTHRINDFRECTSKYKKQRAYPNTPKHHYAIFISELLASNSAPMKSNKVANVLFYALSEKSNNIPKVDIQKTIESIRKEININISPNKFLEATICNRGPLAFLTHRTAENYLKQILA